MDGWLIEGENGVVELVTINGEIAMFQDSVVMDTIQGNSNVLFTIPSITYLTGIAVMPTHNKFFITGKNMTTFKIFDVNGNLIGESDTVAGGAQSATDPRIWLNKSADKVYFCPAKDIVAIYDTDGNYIQHYQHTNDTVSFCSVSEDSTGNFYILSRDIQNGVMVVLNPDFSFKKVMPQLDTNTTGFDINKDIIYYAVYDGITNSHSGLAKQNLSDVAVTYQLGGAFASVVDAQASSDKKYIYIPVYDDTVKKYDIATNSYLSDIIVTDGSAGKTINTIWVMPDGTAAYTVDMYNHEVVKIY